MAGQQARKTLSVAKYWLPMPARSIVSNSPFLRTLFVRATSSVHRRPTGGAAEAALCVLALTSYFQFRRLDARRGFPSQISTGQAQRVLILMALLHSPPLLIADEPTSAIDVITQREVLDLLARTGRERHMSMLFISHDLLAIAGLCHRLAILHEGEIVECGPVKSVLAAPTHPYTKRLVAALPKWEVTTT